jgi:hypothetical protein
MTQEATITQTAPSQPGISRLAYHYVGSLVGQVATLPASVSMNFPALLVLAKMRMRANSGYVAGICLCAFKINGLKEMWRVG